MSKAWSPDDTPEIGCPWPVRDPASVSVPGYEIEEVLGRGGMGVVYKARHLKLKRTVALKMVLAGGHAGPRELARFRIGAEAVARLQHPNIVQIHEVGEAGGHPFRVLEFVEGGNLASKLDGKPMPARDAAKLVEALARAMQLAHSRNIVHRDLKPANILLTADGTPKIADFGLARQIDSDSDTTQVGEVMGTPSYMAPEQASGRAHEAGPPADVYALGAILYDCLSVQKAPKFVGIEFDQPIDFGPGIDSVLGAEFGFGITGNISARVGFEFGFYVNAGSASLYHAGSLTYDVQEPAGVGPTVISTANVLSEGGLFTVSPKLSAYVDLVLEFHFNVHVQAAFFDSFDLDLPPVNIAEKFSLFSINRQVADARGQYVFNPDGTPQFDGQVKLVGLNMIDEVAGYNSVIKAIDGVKEKFQNGTVDKKLAQAQKFVARTPQAKAAADAKIDAAIAKIEAAKAEKASLADASKQKLRSGEYGLGAPFFLTFKDARDGLLGAVATVFIGGSIGDATARLELGSLKLTLPDISLTDSERDAAGKLSASTKNFVEGSEQDQNRQLLDITVNPLALIGIGEYSVCAIGLCVEATPAKYDFNAKRNVNQTVEATRVPSQEQVQFASSNPDTGAPMNVTTTVVGGATTVGSSVSFVPGQTLQIVTPPGTGRVHVTPVLTEA